MSCASCQYLKQSIKKEGCVSGCVYYCSKYNKYVNGTDNCSDFLNDYGRKSYDSNKIYEDGEQYYNDSTPISAYLFILIFLIILGLILGVFK